VWFLLHLVIESSVIGLELVFEHRTYVPSMLLSLLVVMLVARYVRPGWLRVTGLGLLALVWAVWTYERNQVWATEEALWRDAVVKAPHKARPHYNLGGALAQQGTLVEAIAHYREALRLRPTYTEAYNNLGVALATQGNLTEAMAHYREALRFGSTSYTYAETHYNLGGALAQQGNLVEAIAHYREALRLRPTYTEAYHNLGRALATQGNLAEAMAQFTKVLQLQPTSAAAHHDLGLLFLKQRQPARAIAAFEAALRYRPDWPQAANNLAWLLATRDRPSPHEVAEAVRLAEQACQATGYREAAMLDTLAVAYATAGRIVDAVHTARQALEQAEAAGQERLVRQLQERLAGYENAGKP
jgi:Flp pilus assembly protein TadD